MPVTAHSAEYLALLRGCLADPGDDTGWLVFADWLEERATTERVTCPKCKGNKTVRVPNRSEETKHEIVGFVSQGGMPPVALARCPECSGAGTVARSEMGERAELVRVEVRIARSVAYSHAPAEWAALHDRRRVLLAANPQWSRWPCPECQRFRIAPGTTPCEICNGSGDLMKSIPDPDKNVVWHPGRVASRVTVPTMDELLELCEGGSGWAENNVEPSARLRTLASADTPWGVPVGEVCAADRVPTEDPIGRWSWVGLGIPRPVFKLCKGVFPTPGAATAALGRALALWGRVHGGDA